MGQEWIGLELLATRGGVRRLQVSRYSLQPPARSHVPRLSALALLVVLLAPFLVAQTKSPALTSARELLESRAEQEVNDGADICLKENSVAAVELMLEMLEQTERRTHLHLAPGHFRDIVWDRLCKITDHYARARIEHELKNGQDQRVRQWCAELLGMLKYESNSAMQWTVGKNEPEELLLDLGKER